VKVVVNLLWILSSGGTEPRLKKHLTDVLRCLSASPPESTTQRKATTIESYRIV